MTNSTLSTTYKPFFPCSFGNESIFAVREGIPLEDAMNTASCILDIAKASAYAEDEPGSQFSAAYLIEMAKAIVDSVSQAIVLSKKDEAVEG